MARKRKQPRWRPPPPLTENQILRWADAYHKLTGRWPTRDSRPLAVPGAPDEPWSWLDTALRVGRRGLPGGSSLARLLAARRGVRIPYCLPPLTVPQVLAWADAWHARTGDWPRTKDAL